MSVCLLMLSFALFVCSIDCVVEYPDGPLRVCLFARLVVCYDWCIVLFVACLVGWLIDGLIGCFIGCLIACDYRAIK